MVRTPRGAFRWTAYVLGVTAFAAAVPTPLYPVYEARFGFAAGVLGLVFAAYTPGVFLTLFVLAPQAERIGRRKLLTIGMLLTIAGSAVFLFASGVAWLALGRAVSGLAVGATTSVATAAMSDLEPYRDQHHVARVAVAANFGAFALGVLLSGIVVEYVAHAAQIVYLLPIAGSAVGLLAIRATPETAAELGEPRTRWLQRIAVPAEVRRPFWVATGGIAACYSIYGLFGALIPSYVRTGLHQPSHLVAGGIVALMFGTAAAIQLATSQIRDRRALLVGFPTLVAALLLLVGILPLANGTLVVVAATALGAAVGLTLMGSITLIDRLAPERERGEILAGFYLAGYLALAVPTIGVAEASERIGLVRAGILFGAILAVAAAILCVATYRTPTPPGGGGRPRGSAATEKAPRATNNRFPGD